MKNLEPSSFLFHLELQEDLKKGGFHQIQKYFFADVENKLNSVEAVLLVQRIVKSRGDEFHKNVTGMRLFRIQEMSDVLQEFE
jgi:virulence-associated protein VapD